MGERMSSLVGGTPCSRAEAVFVPSGPHLLTRPGTSDKPEEGRSGAPQKRRGAPQQRPPYCTPPRVTAHFRAGFFNQHRCSEHCTKSMNHVSLEDLRRLVAAATCSWDQDLRERTWLIIEQLLDGDAGEDLGLALAAWLQECAAQRSAAPAGLVWITAPR